MTRSPLAIVHGRVRRPHALWLSMLGGTMCAPLLTLLLSGCGASDNGVTAKSAGEIFAATRTAAQSASSVHIASRSTAGGANFTLDASLARDRGSAQVAILGMNLRAIRTGSTLYVKGNRLFAARMGSVLGVKVPANTWLKGPATGALSQTGAFTDLKSEVPLILSGAGTVTKGARVNLGRQPAITLKLTRKLYAGTLYVATTGQPYPLKLTKTGQETGQTTFTNWNDPVTVTPPAHAVEIAKLQHLKGG